jgi:hypothetical protein
VILHTIPIIVRCIEISGSAGGREFPGLGPRGFGSPRALKSVRPALQQHLVVGFSPGPIQGLTQPILTGLRGSAHFDVPPLLRHTICRPLNNEFIQFSLFEKINSFQFRACLADDSHLGLFICME